MEKPTDRKWYQKKRYVIPAALIGLSLIFGGSDTAPVTTHVGNTVAPETTRAVKTQASQINLDAEYETLKKQQAVTKAQLEKDLQEFEAEQEVELSNDNYYINVDGDRVHSPAYSDDGIPPGASAICGDGTYSFSQNRRGTCSRHGGVAEWL